MQLRDKYQCSSGGILSYRLQTQAEPGSTDGCSLTSSNPFASFPVTGLHDSPAMTNPHALPQQVADRGQAAEPSQQERPEPKEFQEPREPQDALVSSPLPSMPERLSLTQPMSRLPVELDVAVPVRDFRVRKLVDLEPGQVIETRWEDTGDLPLTAGDVQLAWSEFEVVDRQMAVRITRLV